jgi:hypothetical protein
VVCRKCDERRRLIAAAWERFAGRVRLRKRQLHMGKQPKDKPDNPNKPDKPDKPGQNKPPKVEAPPQVEV